MEFMPWLISQDEVHLDADNQEKTFLAYGNSDEYKPTSSRSAFLSAPGPGVEDMPMDGNVMLTVGRRFYQILFHSNYSSFQYIKFTPMEERLTSK